MADEEEHSYEIWRIPAHQGEDADEQLLASGNLPPNSTTHYDATYRGGAFAQRITLQNRGGRVWASYSPNKDLGFVARFDVPETDMRALLPLHPHLHRHPKPFVNVIDGRPGGEILDGLHLYSNLRTNGPSTLQFTIRQAGRKVCDGVVPRDSRTAVGFVTFTSTDGGVPQRLTIQPALGPQHGVQYTVYNNDHARVTHDGLPPHNPGRYSLELN